MSATLSPQLLAHKVKNKASLSALKLKLKLKAMSGQPPIFDYGWIKLPYSDDGDVQELYYHAHQQEYYQNDMAVLRQYVHAGDCVIDVGANMGFVTAMLASLVGKDGKIYSFEPSAITYQKLLKTIAANDLSMVEAVNSGLGEADSTHELYRVSGSSGNDTMVESGTGKVSTGQVNITSLDSYLAKNTRPITFLKIDTEGFELQVLRGSMETLKKHRPVIYIELCADYLDSSLESVKLLQSSGYKLPADLDVSCLGNGSNFIALPG